MVSIEKMERKSARFMPFGTGAVNLNRPLIFRRAAEKIVQNATVSAPFHRREPREIKLVRPNPAHTPKFSAWLRDIHKALRSSQAQQKIMMALPAESLFREAGREPIAVRAFHSRNRIGASRQRNLLKDFARQRVPRRFTSLDPALWKLPTARPVCALAD